jgi:CubicO group peptidase (beta-lactamase class C family)
VARQEPVPGAPPHYPDPGSPAGLAIPPAILPTADLANRRDVLTSDIVAMGTMTARGVARVYAGLLGHADVPLVSPDRLTELARPVYEGPDEVMGVTSTWAFGFDPYRPGGVPARPGSTFGMVGGNGSAAWADIDSGLAVAVMRNRFSSDWNAAGEIDRLVAGLFPTPSRPAQPRGARS